MKIQLLCMGPTREKAVADSIRKYVSRIPHYMPFEMVCLPDVKVSLKTSQMQQKELEGRKFLENIVPADFVVLLDERGKEYTSRDFADFIGRKSVELPRNLIFIIGGPYGFSQQMYERANARISLSKMTFPHELVRLFIVEQLYRAQTILRGEPYHHD